MGKQVNFLVTATSAASPSAIYALLSDGATWPDWSPIDAFELEKEGGTGGESKGAIRVFTTGRSRSREELLELRPGQLLSYSLLSGLPIRHHRATVSLQPAAEGTVITWQEVFETTRPGSTWLLTRLLRRFVQKCADGLAAHASQVSGEPGKPAADRPFPAS